MNDKELVTIDSAGSILPRSVGQAIKLSEVIAQSSIGRGFAPGDIFLLMQWALEVRMPILQALQQTHNIHGKLSQSAEYIRARILAQPDLHAFSEKCYTKEGKECGFNDPQAHRGECRIVRKKRQNGHTIDLEAVGEYDLTLAAQAGLTTKDNWKNYRFRMLKHRPFCYAAKDCYADILHGMDITEERELVAYADDEKPVEGEVVEHYKEPKTKPADPLPKDIDTAKQQATTAEVEKNAKVDVKKRLDALGLVGADVKRSIPEIKKAADIAPNYEKVDAWLKGKEAIVEEIKTGLAFAERTWADMEQAFQRAGIAWVFEAGNEIADWLKAQATVNDLEQPKPEAPSEQEEWL